MAEKYISTHTGVQIDNAIDQIPNKVDITTTVNGKALSNNISLNANDVGAAASIHDHDSRYYTESEIDNKLSTKLDIVLAEE